MNDIVFQAAKLMSEKIRSLNSSDADVLYIDFEGQKSLFAHTTHRVDELQERIEDQLTTSRYITQWEREQLLGEGIDCKYLERGKPDWRKGKLRVRLQLEFVPEEEPETENSIEFPLDDIRQSLNGTI